MYCPDAEAQAHYVLACGCRCPVLVPQCGSREVDSIGPLVWAGAGELHRLSECRGCGAQWWDVFRLVGFRMREGGLDGTGSLV